MSRPYEDFTPEEHYPTIASTENFEIWDDVEDDVYILSFNQNGVTVAIDHGMFDELAQVIASAASYHKTQGNGRLSNDQPSA